MEPLRLPFEQLVRQTFEGLAQHHEAAADGIPSSKVQVAQPAAAPAVAPFRGQHDEVERVNRLDLEPGSSPAPRLVGCIERLRHDPLVPGFQGRGEEGFARLDLAGHQPLDPQRTRQRFRQRGDALLARKVDQAAAVYI